MMLEQILIILLLFVFLLMSVLVERLKGRQRQASREVKPTVPPVPVRAPLPVPPRVVGPRRPREEGRLKAPSADAVAEESRGAPLPMGAPPRVRFPRAHVYVGNRREVRRGIVLMTLLGPCRALEPPHPRQ
jgi:hypothetical protein